MSVIAGLVCGWLPLHAADYTWGAPAGGDWNNAANWNPNSGFPDGPDDTAHFVPTFAETTTVYFTENLNIGTLTMATGQDGRFRFLPSAESPITVAVAGHFVAYQTEFTTTNNAVPFHFSANTLQALTFDANTAGGLFLENLSDGTFTIHTSTDIGNSAQVRVGPGVTNPVSLGAVTTKNSLGENGKTIIDVAWNTSNNNTVVVESLRDYGTVTESGSSTGSVLRINGNQSFAVTFDGYITESLSVQKQGSGTQVLGGFGTNTYTGPTTISGGVLEAGKNAAFGTGRVTVEAGATARIAFGATLGNAVTIDGGTLDVRGTLATGSERLQFSENGGTLMGNGFVGESPRLNNTNHILAPGPGAGALTFTESQGWYSFTYEWDVNNWTGVTPGGAYDQMQVTGVLDILTDSEASIILEIGSLSGGNQAGNVANFSEMDRSWSILTATNGITGFDASRFQIDTSGFSSATPALGTWVVSQIGNDIVLSYTAVPEPNALVLLGIGVSTLFIFRRRKKRDSQDPAEASPRPPL